jgi:protein TonB
MFDAWEIKVDTAEVQRFAWATAGALALMAGGAAWLSFVGNSPSVKKEEKKIAVAFRPLPKPAERVKVEPPPPPLIKKLVKPTVAATPSPVAAPAPMVAPKEIPKKAAPEASNEQAVAALDVAVGGTGSGVKGGGVEAAPDADESAAPVVATASKNMPVNLPEEADPPEPSEDNEQPEYPEIARASGLEARVVLKIVVEASGKVGRLQVLRGEEPFLSAATAAVKTWTYEPARLDGEPITVFKIVDLKFRLRE